MGAQECRALGESGALGHRLGEGGGERAGTRDVGRARADRTLVTAAGTVGRHGDATPGEKDANTGGRADLVPAHAHEVEAKLCERNIQSRDRLSSIRMRKASAGVDEGSEVCNRLDRTDLGGHEGHGSEREASVPGRGSTAALSRWQHRQATRVDGQNLPLEALARRDLSLVGDRVMLEVGDNDEVASTLAATHAAGGRHHAEGIGFSGTGGEDDLVDVGTECSCYLLARVVQHATGTPPSKVEGGGIAGGGGQVTLGAGPRLEGALAQRRRGRMVEVDAHAWERASSMIARAAGTTSATSPTTPKSAISKIGASGSSHTATMWAADCMPTVW